MFEEAIDCINYIENLRRGDKKRDLGIINKCLDELGNPENLFKKIHISGTNGKGSTLNFLKNILLEDGFKVSTFTSPYILNFNERISYNDTYISNDDLINVFNIVYDLHLKYNLTFFEFVFLMFIKYSSIKKVNYAIIEVGIGGLYDTTNAIDYDLSLLTNVSYDHMNYLGNSLNEILDNKLGIVKENGHLITTIDEEFYDQIKIKLDQINASYKFVNIKNICIYSSEMTSFSYDIYTIDLNMIGIHQAYNAALSIEAALYLENTSMKKIKKGLENTFFKGRMERCMLKPRIIIDGAHNIGGIKALIYSVNKIYKDKRKIYIYSAFKDKDTKSCINELDNNAHKIIFTSFDNPRIKDPKELYNESNIENKEIIIDYKEAINLCINEFKNDVIIITGSLYFIAEVRKFLRN